MARGTFTVSAYTDITYVSPDGDEAKYDLTEIPDFDTSLVQKEVKSILSIFFDLWKL